MSEKEINERYIINRIKGQHGKCLGLNKIVPTIHELMKEAYTDGLKQGKFDGTMEFYENGKVNDYEVLKRLKDYINTLIEEKKDKIKNNKTFLYNKSITIEQEQVLLLQSIMEKIENLEKIK